MIGGAVGFAIASRGTRVRAAFIAGGIPSVSLDIGPDGWVLMLTAIISFLAAQAAGIVPALRAARSNVAPGLRDDARTLGKGHAAAVWTRALVALRCE